jgi:NTE family protein
MAGTDRLIGFATWPAFPQLSRFPSGMADTIVDVQELDEAHGDLGVVLTGGGARGAYQVGVLSWLARQYPDLRIPIVTGVSAGAVNAGHLAAHHGTFGQAMEELVGLWSELTTDNVFRVDPPAIAMSALRWGLRLVSGGHVGAPAVRSLLDTEPLSRHLEEVYAAVDRELTGVDYNLRRGKLRAVAITTTSYSTGQSVVFVQGRDIQGWTRPKRRSVHTHLRVDHVLASTSLPLFFPAVRIEDQWYGDGGIRQTAPLSPALHLGARRILAISTRFGSSQARWDRPKVIGYPPPAQVVGVLMNAIFLDLIDQDEIRLERLNRLLRKLPREEREGLSPIDLIVIRPSRDLARIAGAYEPRLPKSFRFMTRGLGTRETRSPDLLSMLMFQADYLRRLIRLGEQDAEACGKELTEFIEKAATAPAPPRVRPG